MRAEEKKANRAKAFTPSILDSGTPEAQKIAAKRERVMEAAFELMGQRGVRAVTMGDVSEYLRARFTRFLRIRRSCCAPFYSSVTAISKGG